MRTTLLCSCFALLTACATAPATDFTARDAGASDATDHADTSTVDTQVIRHDAGPPADPPDVTETNPDDNVLVYGHTAGTLYSVQPRTYAVTRIGDFVWPAGTTDLEMTDIALTRDGKMWGVTRTNLYRVNIITRECDHVARLSGDLTTAFNALTFTPNDDGTEDLIGAARSGGLYRIDQTTGATTMLGTYNNRSDTYQSSGDIVSIVGAGTFATVVVGNTEYLARVDIRSGISNLIGPTHLSSDPAVGTWGLAYWGGKLYGFTSDGRVAIIDIGTGEGTVVDTQRSLSWYGAGVTTVAPIVPPV